MTTQSGTMKTFQLKDLKLLSLFLSVLLQTQLQGQEGRSREQGNCPRSALVPCSCPPPARAPGAPTLALAQGRVMTTEGLPAQGSPASPAPSPLPRPTKAGQWAAGSLRTFSDRGSQAGTPVCTPLSALLASAVDSGRVSHPSLASTVITSASVYRAPQSLKTCSHLICTAIP